MKTVLHYLKALPHELHVGRNETWRIVVGFSAIMFFYAFALAALLAIIAFIEPFFPEISSLQGLLTDERGTSRAFAVLTLVSFCAFFPAVHFVAKWLHHRHFWSLFGRDRRQFLRDLMFSLGLSGFILACAGGLSFLVPQSVGPGERELVLQMPVAQWLLHAPLALLFLVPQVVAEELVFRGYLLQHLQERYRSPWIWLVLPSVLFALLHYDSEIGFANVYQIIAITFIGVLLSLMTLKTGNLGAAIGLHYVNNAFVMVLMANEDFMSGFALWNRKLDLALIADNAGFFMLDGIALLIFAGLWWRYSAGRTIHSNMSRDR